MRALALSLGAASLVSCASAVESSKLEDVARRNVPVAICLKPLARHGAGGVVSALKPEDYWTMLLPGYDASSGTVDRAAVDCSGGQRLQTPDLMQAEGPRTGPVKVTEADVSVEAGPDGFKILWLRTHHFSDGSAAGPLALVRAREAYAEVYAIGLYRGDAAHSRFAFERLGPEILVTATADGCTGVKPNQDCETNLVVYLLSSGELLPGARFALDRIQYGQAAGVTGTAQYRFTATPVFEDKSIRVVEQVTIQDPTQGEVRKIGP